MKPSLIICIFLFLLTCSCIQEEDVFRADQVQYEVSCAYCIVYFIDDTQREKHFVVNGSWAYEFNTVRLDSVYLRLGKSALIDKIQVDANIKVGGDLKASYSDLLGWDEEIIKWDMR